MPHQQIQQIISSYLTTVDESIERLSEHKEGKLSNLPSWVIKKRKVDIGVMGDNDALVIKITPDESLDDDVINIIQVNNISEVNNIISPMFVTGGFIDKNNENQFDTLGDISIVETNNPLAVPALENKAFMGWGRILGFKNTFGPDKAKEDSVNFWNSAIDGLNPKVSYVQETRKILETFQALIKRKSFVERRIHRYVNEHKSVFLPEHKTCHFEHRLYLNGVVRIADFILEREQGLPSIFIELESPVHKVFTKCGNLTAESNHARQQISEWVKYVEQESKNAEGEFKFLTGPKEKMVVIGTGLEKRDALIDTKYDGVSFWTYSLMLEEARNRMNQRLSSQYKMLGLKEVSPF